MTVQTGSRFRQMPVSVVGRWAAVLFVIFIVMFLVNSFVFMPAQIPENAWYFGLLPFYGLTMLACGLTGGGCALVALLREHERAWPLWLPLLSAAFVLFLLVGELLFPH